MFYKLNLKKRILLGYLIPLLLMIGVAGAVYSSMQTLQALSAATKQANRIVQDGKEVHVSIAQYQRDTRGYLIQQDKASQKAAQQSKMRFAEQLRRLEEYIVTPEQRDRLAILKAHTDRVSTIGNAYSERLAAGDKVKAIQIFKASNLIDLSGQIDRLMDEFEAHEVAILETKSQHEQVALTRLITVTLVATVLAVILAIVIGQWIATRISQAIGESIARMSSSSTEIAATVDEHERTVAQQVSALSQVSATVGELDASARQSASQAESSAAAAVQALGLTQEGIQSANQAMQSLTHMKAKIDSVVSQILRLSEQAGQIGSLSKFVGELANETNMLALNAAVEAARAGDQGKGFAVVATEIRKLAVQSKKSAERADALVAEIQKATNSAVIMTEDGSRSADAGIAVAQQSVEDLGAIASAANSIVENAQQVLLNSQQQAMALAQVTEAMQSLAAGSRQMAAGTEQTKVGVHDLKRVALGLKALV